jgi:cytochrome c biogenesis protein
LYLLATSTITKIARRCQFFRTTGQFYRLKISTILNKFSFNKILTTIKRNDYSIFQQKNTVYCYKGLTGRIAPILVHFSMILVLLGTIIGSLFGFKAQESSQNGKFPYTKYPK